MSTNYRFSGSFTRKQVTEAINRLNLQLPKHKQNSNVQFLVSSGECYVWAYCAKDGSDVEFTRYGDNYSAESDILEPIAAELGTGLISGHDKEYFEEEDEE